MSGYEGHTPGPWEWEFDGPKGEDRDAFGLYAPKIKDEGRIILTASEWSSDYIVVKSPADAALIAAAPSLLTRVEALERGLRAQLEPCDACIGRGDCDERIEIARQLLNGNEEGTP